MRRWPAVALRTCTVTFTGPSGIRHSVEVTAESIYEAAALGVSALRKSGWADAIVPGTALEIEVREPATSPRGHLLEIVGVRSYDDHARAGAPHCAFRR